MLIFMIGAPGSGKGTLGKKWCTESNFHHISVGDVLRNQVVHDPAVPAAIKASIQEQRLLSTLDIVDIMRSIIAKASSEGHEHLLIDGFPRTVDQANEAEKAGIVADYVLYLRCPEHIAKERYETRGLPGRDTNPEVFVKRYKEFRQLNGAVLEKFEDGGILMTIDSSKNPETSYAKLVKALQSKVIKEADLPILKNKQT